MNNKRGSVIRTFSNEARQNMMYTIAHVRRDCLPCFVTLTYPKVYSENPKEWKRHLHMFARRLDRKFENVAGIWKLEPQKRGAPHYHLLLWGVPLSELQRFVPVAWNEIVAKDDNEHLRWHRGEMGNGNIHCVQEVATQKAMYTYVTKYINKSAVEGWQNVGKWWGILWKSRMPFGEKIIYDITDKDVYNVIRMMRRYTGSGSGFALQSRQQICDADQWMEKIQTRPMGSYLDWLRRIESNDAVGNSTK